MIRDEVPSSKGGGGGSCFLLFGGLNCRELRPPAQVGA